MTMNISVVIPSYNEENINELIIEFKKFFKNKYMIMKLFLLKMGLRQSLSY